MENFQLGMEGPFKVMWPLTDNDKKQIGSSCHQADLYWKLKENKCVNKELLILYVNSYLISWNIR